MHTEINFWTNHTLCGIKPIREMEKPRRRSRIVLTEKIFMRIEILKRSAVMLYLTVVFSVFTIAQNTTSTLTGTTSDSDDILPGAVVKLTEVQSRITYSSISNQKGQFRITVLTPGGP